MDIAKHTFRSTKFKRVIQEAIRFMMASPVHSLAAIPPFPGPGVYALYYGGAFELYEFIAALNLPEETTPIYVGKAVPPGWRTGRSSIHSSESSQPLRARLAEHAANICVVENLSIDDFTCRFMILAGIQSDLISACEAQLIRQFGPLWNTTVDGFGNHTPGEGRFGQARSEWDVLHPGRTWAARCRGTPIPMDTIVAKIARHSAG